MPFDRAYQVVVAGGKVIYGSSADGIVYALDADSGNVQWRFYTDGPVRFAPALSRDRVFVASDDGYLYALQLPGGQLLWKRRGGPNPNAVLGNQRLISKWPARGGPVVADDAVYFAAGIWPSDGIFLYALDAADGDVLWCNDDSGEIYMPQPHGGANAKSGLSAQGYLVVSKDRLLVPTGRAVPALVDRGTGKFECFHLQKYGQYGGTPTMAVGWTFFNSGLGFSNESGEKTMSLGSGQLAASDHGVVRADPRTVEAYRWEQTESPDRKGRPTKTPSFQRTWSVSGVAGDASLIVAANKIVCGSDGKITIVDAVTRETVWSEQVDGVVYGLAAANGQLLASTDKGLIYCFDGGGQHVPSTTAKAKAHIPFQDNEPFGLAADEIVRMTGVTDGYCVDLGCGDGALAYELAKRTKLHICAVDDDRRAVDAARRQLTAAGIYGARVVVHQRDLASTGYPQDCANLVVSGRSVTQGAQPVPAGEAHRLQRPFGGVICTGKPGKMNVDRRGPRAGVGRWTHQYADAANTLNSNDQVAGGRLTMRWFRDVDFDVPQRHGRAPSPLYDRGRLFHPGLHGIVAVDAYNGHELWRHEIAGLLRAYDGDELMGAAGTGSNCCVCGDSVFVRDNRRCLRLDVGTGKQLGELRAPPGPDGRPGTWGYVACEDGILFGTVANTEHVVTYRYRSTTGDMTRLLTESHSLFAMAPETGRLLWHYPAKHSIRHNAIAIAGGKLFLIDRPLAMFDREKRPRSKEHPTGRLLALSAKTGKVLWESEEDIYGTMLAVSEQHGVLLMSYQATRFRLDSEIGGRMTAFQVSDGNRRWDIQARYESRPLINGDVIYAQGGAWKLLTGEPQPFSFQRSYGCGILAASRNLMVFRSATLGYCDFEAAGTVNDYGGIRPGCWVNALPVGGLVLVPDATAGCRCSYLNRAWIALEPASEPAALRSPRN